MRNLCNKGLLLVGGLVAACAFAPPMASGASWAVVGTTHVLSSGDLSLTANFGAPTFFGAICADTELHADVVSAAQLRITGAAFRNCTGNVGTAIGCSLNTTATNLPWTATAVTTTNIQIHNIDMDVRFTGSCFFNGLQTRWTGTLTGGTFSPNATPSLRRLHLNHAPGLTSHSSAGSFAVFLTATFRDTTNTLNVLDDGCED